MTPDYAAGITTTGGAGTIAQNTTGRLAQCYVGGEDSYMSDLRCYISPNSSFSPQYEVGRNFNDINSNTRGYNTMFLLPAGWYVKQYWEGANSKIIIYPLGVN